MYKLFGRKYTDKGMSTAWVHYKSVSCSNDKTTVCGKTARRIVVTNNINKVTCIRCIEELKKNNWFCINHGFVNDSEVTFEERCVYCNRPVTF